VNSKAAKWASKPLEDLLRELDTDPNKGVSSTEVEERLRRYGANRLVEEKEERFFDVLREEITEPMILLLLTVGVLYSIWGGILDALTIFTIIIILVLVEVYNEYKAKRSIKALRKLASPSVLALRDGQLKSLPTEQLVPGDIFPLKVGERVSADARLIKSYGLQADESSLTGESLPVIKDAEAVSAETAEITELTNMVFAGTLITQGEGLAAIVATGRSTELGRVAELAKATKVPRTPLQLAMRELAGVLVWIALFFSVLIPVLGFLRGQPFETMILTGLSLAFATIPEEMPIIITMVLAVGAYTLSQKHALVKRLRAAETLGSVTVIATDKTGTITENTMSLGHAYVNGEIIQSLDDSEREILETSLLATGSIAVMEYETVEHLNPMGAALLEAAKKTGVDVQGLKNSYILRNEFTFDNSLKMASYIYQHGKDLYLFVSGAPEAIIDKSTMFLENKNEALLTQKEKQKVTESVDKIAQMGERALAVAYRRISREEKTRKDLEKELVFATVVSFIDPPRPEVRDAIRSLHEAGIRVIMLTGDHPNTARAVAAQVEIDSHPRLLTGAEVSSMSDAQLREALKNTSVFARITPEHKLRIVRFLKDMGEVVAVTGDGVNDAPALQEAEIGISMGVRGTDVAKEAADMILTDDNFATIGHAVREGRKIFDNLKKGVRYYLAVKVALVAIFLLPILIVVPLPFPPIQIVLLELFMDLAASSGFVAEPEEADVMKRRPRNPKERFMTRAMMLSIFVSAFGLFAAVSACYLFTYYQTGDVIHAQTVAFATWIFTHVFLALNLRSERQPLFKLGFFSNRIIIGWALTAVAMLLAVTTIPLFQTLLKTSTLREFDWALVLLVSFLSTFWLELLKWLRPRKQ
jgi:Ca2+-transporting ATPase